MSLKEDTVLLVVGVAVLIGALYYAKKKIADVIPPVVKDGAEAAGVLASNAVTVALHPFDGFGIAPRTFGDGTLRWEPTTPWTNANDQVSNNDTGINFNLF